MKPYHPLLLAVFFSMTGCSNNDHDQATSEQTTDKVVQQADKKAVLTDQMAAIEKAKQVEKLLQNKFDEQDKAITGEDNKE